MQQEQPSSELSAQPANVPQELVTEEQATQIVPTDDNGVVDDLMADVAEQVIVGDLVQKADEAQSPDVLDESSLAEVVNAEPVSVEPANSRTRNGRTSYRSSGVGSRTSGDGTCQCCTGGRTKCDANRGV